MEIVCIVVAYLGDHDVDVSIVNRRYTACSPTVSYSGICLSRIHPPPPSRFPYVPSSPPYSAWVFFLCVIIRWVMWVDIFSNRYSNISTTHWCLFLDAAPGVRRKNLLCSCCLMSLSRCSMWDRFHLKYTACSLTKSYSGIYLYRIHYPPPLRFSL